MLARLVRLAEDDQGRTFELEPTKDRIPELFNSTELRFFI